MNKKQLEDIRCKINEINALLTSDREGAGAIMDRLSDLDGAVVSELKSVVWDEYEKSWKIIPSP